MANMKIAYVITERNGKTFWNRVGVAFTNRDGSINVILDSLPVSGRLQLRDYISKDEPRGQPHCCCHETEPCL